jgi:hypothetical protein
MLATSRAIPAVTTRCFVRQLSGYHATWETGGAPGVGAQASGQATLVAVIEPRTPLTNEGESSVDRSETRAIASDTAMASGTSA